MEGSKLDHAMCAKQLLIVAKDKVEAIEFSHVLQPSRSQHSHIGITQLGHHMAVAIINSRWAIVAHIGCVAVSDAEASANAMAKIYEVKKLMDRHGIAAADENLHAFLIYQREPRLESTRAGQWIIPTPVYRVVYHSIRHGLHQIIGLFSHQVLVETFLISTHPYSLSWTGQGTFLIKREENRTTVYLENRPIYPQTTD